MREMRCEHESAHISEEKYHILKTDDVERAFQLDRFA
jgi:hypothetical protein